MVSKKEVKDSYKEMKFLVGVFQIRNLTNGKVFIDSSTDLVSIWNRHRFQLNGGRHHNSALQKEWAETGQENFVFEMLSEIKQDTSETTDYRKLAKGLLLMFIDELQPYGDKGYMCNREGN